MESSRMIIGVLGLAMNSKGEFLVTFRCDDREQMNNKWQVPGGGMEYGEKAEQTLLREMKEELGVDAKILFPYSFNYTQTWESEETNSHVFLVTYVIDIGNQEITLNEEATQYKWVTSETLDRQNSLPATHSLLVEAERLTKQYL